MNSGVPTSVSNLEFSRFFFSINPEIDVGQIEGAFTMGLGYWLTEKLIFDPDTGQLLTHNTWVCVLTHSCTGSV